MISSYKQTNLKENKLKQRSICGPQARSSLWGPHGSRNLVAEERYDRINCHTLAAKIVDPHGSPMGWVM